MPPDGLHRIPGIFSTLFLFFQIVFHRLGRFCLRTLWRNSHSRFLVHPQDICQHITLILTVYNLIYKTVLQQELRSLESLRKLLTNGLLNDTRSCKADQRVRLCQNDIP